MTPTAKIVNVTPAMARKWLGANTNNRNISKRHVALFIGIINRGLWHLTNDAICIGADGTLYNAQHRLTALVETGATLPFMVLEGATPEMQKALDTGLRLRRPHEQMKILGLSDGASTAKDALCRAVLNYDNEKGPYNRFEPLSQEEIIDLAMGDKMLDDAISMAAALGRQIDGAKVTAIAHGYYLILDAWLERATEFHERLASGANLGANSPILRLRNILAQRQVKQKSEGERRKLLAVFLKAFNLWIDGREIEALGFRVGEEWPAPFTSKSYQKLLADRERYAKGMETRRRKAENGS